MTVETKIPETLSEAEIQQLWSESRDREFFLQQLFNRGASKLESIRALRHVAAVSLNEAKEAVHFSTVWAKRRTADDAFHQTALQAWDEAAGEEYADAGRLAS